MGTNLYGPSINIFDPLFGATTDDAQTAPQMALLALGTEPNSLDEFPDFGFVFDEQAGRCLDPTALAMLPLDVRAGLLAEPAFTDATVTIASATETEGGGISVALSIQIVGAEGDAVGFTLASDG